MQNRIPMNSKSLQEAFPEVYRNFFSKCTVVNSTPASFIWSGEYVSIFGGFSISQTLPFRIYVGLEPISTNEIKSGVYKVFNPSIQQFENHPYDNFIRAKISDLIRSEIPKITGKNANNGFVFHILSEAPAERGLNISGAIAAALSLAIYLNYSKNITQKNVDIWTNQKIIDTINDAYFNKIFRFAWKIESVYHAGTSSGRGALVPFINSFYPIIYFTEKTDPGIIKTENNKSSSSDIFGFNKINNIKYWAYRLNEFFDFDIPSYYWPIDFGLIYSGYENSTASIIRMIPNIKEDLKEHTDQIKQKFIQKTQDGSHKTVSSFHEDCFGSDEEPWETVIKALGIICLKIIGNFENIIRKGHTEEYLQDFFRSINQNQNILHILEASTTSIDHICFSIYERGRKVDIISGVGAKLVGAGHGGDVVFAAPIGIFRKSVEELVLDSKKSYTKDINLDYASWVDGPNDLGIKIEQNLEDKHYSAFVSQGAAKVLHLNQAGNLHADLYTLEEFKKLKNTAMLLFDIVEEEIYIKGQRLTSKEIHSASTTVEIIKILLNNVDKDVKNNQLPESSYTSDRNELQSKIIGPLVRAFAKKTGKKLPLYIHGGLMDFFVKLEKDGLDVHVLEKIF